MLLLNIGSRYVVADLGKFHETLLSNEYVKKIIIFSMFFVATRDVITAFLLTILYVIVIDGLFNEKRKFCILPQNLKSTDNQKSVSNNEYMHAKKIVNAYENKNPSQSMVKENYNNYAKNIKALNKK